MLKIQKYTIKEIFGKNLLFLLPFYIFCHESKFREYDTDEEKLRELQAEYEGIVERLERMCEEGEVSEYVKCTLIDMSKKVAENIAARYANVKKGVTSVMGGKVLEYEAKTILQAGIREGRIEGERKGRIEGRKEGRKEGRLEGERDGKIKGKIEAYAEMIRDGLLGISEAAKRLGISETELEKYL